jgi:hypothetical protein
MKAIDDDDDVLKFTIAHLILLVNDAKWDLTAFLYRP